MNRTHRRSIILSLMVAAGSAYGQTHDQGTLDRQRDRLDDSSIAPSTNGWLNDSTTNHFWAWKLSSSYTLDTVPTHEDMQVWIHHHLWGSSLNMDGTINESELDQQASSIADEIVDGINNGTISANNYALFFQGVTAFDLHNHPDDNLDDSIDLWETTLFNCAPPYSAGSCNAWSSFPPADQSLSRASVWREHGVATADAAFEYLSDEIKSLVEGELMTSFPAPLRIFFDEERGRKYGSNSVDNLASIESIINDSRWNSEALYGNFELWDSSPSTSYASEVLTNSSLLADIDGWNSPCTEYTPNAPVNVYNNCNSYHQNPSYDTEFFPIQSMLNGIYSATIDGAIGAAIDHPLNDPDWGGFKWSNYLTSANFSLKYPQISDHQFGVTHYNATSNERYGHAQASRLGSGEIQSPVLYPPSVLHEDELDADLDLEIMDQLEREARAWIRHTRMQLDHIIFSFPEFDDDGIDIKPHLAPWVLRVGTLVHRIGIEEQGPPAPGQQWNRDDHDIASKKNVRDIVALCKAKGVNELIFWGNPGAEGFVQECDEGMSTQDHYEFNWGATNDVLSQVYDYNLETVFVNGSSIGAEKADMFFSEEHTHDAAPVDLEVTIEAEFDTGSITTLGDKYTFVTEILDGGGPWEDATYTLEIYNYKLAQYETITDTPVTWYSNSTRRAEFTDTDSDGYANEWDRTHDDEGIPNIDDVYDRKNILVWDQFDLLTHAGGSVRLSDYTASSSMRFRLTAEHTTLPTAGQTADPLRIDLVQLYESECENDNIPSAMILAGDLNDDGQANYEDIKVFMDRLLTGDERGLDLNDDGRVDQEDLAILNSMIDRG